MKNTAKASFSLEKGRVPNIPAFFVLQVSMVRFDRITKLETV